MSTSSRALALTRAPAYGALALSIVLQAVALILIRALVAVVAGDDGITPRMLVTHALGSWLLWAGGLSFVVGMGFWILSLQRIPLSIAYPTAAASYVAIAVAGRLLFDEPLTARRLAGIALVMAGVIMLHCCRGQRP